MKFFRPASISRLLFIAFSLVELPLIFALLSANVAVERLARQSQRTVLEAARIVEWSRIVVHAVPAMERNARQFQLLRDPRLHEVYLKRHKEFHQSTEKLAQLDLNSAQRTMLNTLIEQERAIYGTLGKATPDPTAIRRAVDHFSSLNELAQSLSLESSQTIGRKLDRVQQEAAYVRQLLFWQAVTLIPVVLAFAVFGTLLVAWPIRQIEAGIRQLGQGELSSPIEVAGPQDLQELGKRLDWLRLRLLELNEQKTKFLRHVSHELKTPLAAIREGAQLLSDEAMGRLNEAQADIAEILNKNSRLLQKHIEALLSFSNVTELPISVLDRKPVRLDHLVKTVAADQKVSLQAKHLEVHTVVSPIQINGDAQKLRVVLDNLLSNAIKYSPEGGHIRIVLIRRSGQVVLEVQDAGPGIDPDEHDKVFEPFYQGRAVYRGHIKGTGLGLAITQEYIKAHGGKIAVIDQKHGACFRVTLPGAGPPIAMGQGSSPG